MRHRFMIGFAALSLTACTQLQMQPVSPTSNTGTTTQPPVQTEPTVPETISGAVTIGSAGAPVTMTLFTNHSCTYCKEFETTLMPNLQSEFIAPGRLKVLLIEVPLNKYPNSDRDAHILSCASTTQSGAAISTMLFAGRSVFPALKTCLDNTNYLQSAMAKQHEVITGLNVTLVPTYFLNGKRFTGLPDYADLRGEIETELRM